mgnify:CR=1 FL=1
MAMLDTIADQSIKQLDDFKPQEIANTVFHIATAGHHCPALFEAVARETLHRLPHFGPQELANTAWAFATLAVRALGGLGDVRAWSSGVGAALGWYARCWNVV